MKKTIFEQMGGTYTKVGDYYLPNLITTEKEIEIGVWGQRHLRYIKQHHKVRYTNLLTSGKLNAISLILTNRQRICFFGS